MTWIIGGGEIVRANKQRAGVHCKRKMTILHPVTRFELASYLAIQGNQGILEKRLCNVTNLP